MLEQYQTIYENGLPRFAVIDFEEYLAAKEILSNEEKLEDFLDALHIEKIKKNDEESYDLATAKQILGIK